MIRSLNLIFASLLTLLCTQTTFGQNTYDLLVPGTTERAVAQEFADRLVITNAAGVVTYTRDARYDAIGYRGYTSALVKQSVQWPVAGTGNFILYDGLAAPKRSKMQIFQRAPIAPVVPPGRPLVPTIAPVIGPSGEVTLSVKNNTRGAIAVYYVDRTAGRLRKYFDIRSGEVKKQDTYVGDEWQAFDGLGGKVADYTVPRVASPVWNLGVAPAPIVPVTPVPIVPIVPVPPVLKPARVLVSRTVSPNPALSDVTTLLKNNHSKEVWVLVTNLETGSNEKIKVPPGASKSVVMKRDAGATATEIYDVRMPTGLVERRTVKTTIPPKVLYDVSVYELVVQSVSIDRTVPGGKIDEVNRQPKGVGAFQVPAGDRFKGGPSDIYENAASRSNPNSVRTIDPEKWKSGSSGTNDPFESGLERELGPLPK
jgi:hypothetical protein